MPAQRAPNPRSSPPPPAGFRYVPKVMGRLGDSLPVRNFPCSYRNAPKPGKAVCGDKVQLPNRYYVETQPEASFSGRTFESLYFRSCDEDLAYSGGRSWPCEFCSDAPGAGADEPYRYTAVVAANGGVRYIEVRVSTWPGRGKAGARAAFVTALVAGVEVAQRACLAPAAGAPCQS